MTVQPGNYGAEHIGPFEDLLKRDIMVFYGKMDEKTGKRERYVSGCFRL